MRSDSVNNQIIRNEWEQLNSGIENILLTTYPRPALGKVYGSWQKIYPKQLLRYCKLLCPYSFLCLTILFWHEGRVYILLVIS